MGLLARWVRSSGIRAEARPPHDDFWYQPAGGALTGAGIRVTPETALKLSAVWRCIAIISGSVAMLPLPIYRRLPAGGKDLQRQHPLYDVLHDRPNRWQTAYEWRELTQQHVLLRGNAYSRIIAGARGYVDQLIPIHPDAVTPEQQPDTTIKYRIQTQGGVQTLYEDEVFHLRGLSDDGVRGLAVLDHARESLGLGLAQEQYGARFFSQSEVPPIVLKSAGPLKDETRNAIKESWTAATAPLGRKFRAALLEGGIDAQVLNVGLTAEQAQLIESREFTITDIARWFGVPPHLIGETTKETSWGSGIEQMGIGYVIYTLLPWLKRWEQRIAHSLILDTRTYFAEFTVDGLLRGDAKSRAEALNTLRNAGVINADEWRAMENMNPIPNGDGQAFWRPANMLVVGAEPVAPDPAPAPPAPDDSARNPGDALAAVLYERRNGALAGGH